MRHIGHVNQSLMELYTMRHELNGTNNLVEVEALSDQHNCLASLEHLGLSDRKLQSRLTRKLISTSKHQAAPEHVRIRKTIS